MQENLELNHYRIGKNYLGTVLALAKKYQRTRNALNNKYKRQGRTEKIQPITYRQIGTGTESYTAPDGSMRELNFVDIEIQGNLPEINGWKILRVIHHFGKGKNIVTNPTNADIPNSEKWRNALPWCDHCDLDRKRNKTFLLQKAGEGCKQVGTSCIKEYTGDIDLHAYCQYLEKVSEELITLGKLNWQQTEATEVERLETKERLMKEAREKRELEYQQRREQLEQERKQHFEVIYDQLQKDEGKLIKLVCGNRRIEAGLLVDTAMRVTALIPNQYVDESAIIKFRYGAGFELRSHEAVILRSDPVTKQLKLSMKPESVQKARKLQQIEQLQQAGEKLKCQVQYVDNKPRINLLLNQKPVERVWVSLVDSSGNRAKLNFRKSAPYTVLIKSVDHRDSKVVAEIC